MSTISPLNIDKMHPSTVAVLDFMTDGEWHPTNTLLSHAAPVCIATEPQAALAAGRRVRSKALAAGADIAEADIAMSGARDLVRNRLMIAVRRHRIERTKTHYRMLPEVREAWLAARPTTAPTSTIAADGAATTTPVEPEPQATRRTRPALVFGGTPEADGWADAPLRIKSRVHFHTDLGSLPLAEFRADLPAGCTVSHDDTTGLYRVDCPHGTGEQTRDFIREWCAARTIDAKALRVERDVMRRNFTDLDPQFLSDLCGYYLKYSQGVVKKHISTLQYHFTDKDDQDQQIYEWILEAVSRYDDASGVPFGAYLSGRIGCWVHDLNRSKYGRTLSDIELRHQRTQNQFMAVHGRRATEREMAGLLDENLGQFRQQAQVVSVVQGLRNVASLTPGGDEMEIQIADEEMSDDRHNAELMQSLVSQVLTTSCSVDADARGKLSEVPNILGWVAQYEALYNDCTKTDLARGLKTSVRNMTAYMNRAQERMQQNKSLLASL